MKTILAALDSSAADRPVIETALGLAELMGASVDAVHVGDDTADTAEGTASRANLGLRRIPGPVVKVLLAELDEPNVVVGVFGARGLSSGRRPAGRTVLRIMKQTAKPVVVVPPEASGVCPRPFHRVLLPLNGANFGATDVSGIVDAVTGPDSEVVVLHVFDERAKPPIINHAGDQLERWGDEFVSRHLPGREAHFEWRSGYADTASIVVDVCQEQGADLVIVFWAQVLEGHGDVIRALLSHSKIPVLVVPSRARPPAEKAAGLVR